MKLQQGAPSAREPAVSAGTNQEAGPGCVCTGALPMLSCRWHYRAGVCGDSSVFPAVEGGEGGSRWSLRHTVEAT